jgi:hypothetical protein
LRTWAGLTFSASWPPDDVARAEVDHLLGELGDVEVLVEGERIVDSVDKFRRLRLHTRDLSVGRAVRQHADRCSAGTNPTVDLWSGVSQLRQTDDVDTGRQDEPRVPALVGRRDEGRVVRGSNLHGRLGHRELTCGMARAHIHGAHGHERVDDKCSRVRRWRLLG